jgi:hypothetical protein
VNLDGLSQAAVIRETLDEILGFQLAYHSFAKAVEQNVDDNSETKNSSFRNFFHSSTSLYCGIEERGGSMVRIHARVNQLFVGSVGQVSGCLYQKGEYIRMFGAVCQFKLY